MPELPEVETITRILIQGKGGVGTILKARIKDVHILWERTIAEPLVDEFQKQIQGQIIQSISRRGKYLVFTLSKDTLLFHLRMSGDLRVEKPFDEGAFEFGKHDRLIIDFIDGRKLIFEDTRKFGRVWLLDDPEKELGKLGPEPLDDSLSAAEFHKMLTTRKRLIKPLLMDQTFIAGLGNIYTDEALFRSKIHPLSLSNTLSKKQAEKLLEEIRITLNEGIARNGASIDWVYRGGDFQNYLKVYGRAGEECKVCKTEVQRIVVGQRGTHICPNCQKVIH